MARNPRRPSWRPFQPTYVPGTYTSVGLSTLTDKQLAAEYSRVRREAQERLRSFQRSKDPDVQHAAIVAEKAGVYLTRAQIKAAYPGDTKEAARERRGLMEDLLIDAYRFVSAKSSSLSGYRDIQEKQINSLQAAGYEFVTKDNLREFGEFMDYFRSRKEARAYGSDTVALAFSSAAKAGISSKSLRSHFNFYLAQVQAWAGPVKSYAAFLGATEKEVDEDFMKWYMTYKADNPEAFGLQKFKRKPPKKKKR